MVKVMRLRCRASGPLQGRCTVPGDKSISHRGALIGALAEGTTEISNFQSGDDCSSTVSCLRALGVEIETGDTVIVRGRGLRGLGEPDDLLDAGNSGTTTRLLLGILAGQDFYSVITGDRSLRSRPMGRVTEPLTKMGARVWGRQEGTKLPLSIRGSLTLQPVHWQLPVASAQAKSALLLAGLYADGVTTVTSPAASRDHTERMLQAFGAELSVDGLTVALKGGASLQGSKVEVPGDISAAAFLMVAATIIPGSDILIANVGVNPTRTGIIDLLQQMGGWIEVCNERLCSGEPVADLRVRAADLHGVRLAGELIPRLVDEVPALAVAAAAAQGVAEICDAAELRVKETDRLHAVAVEMGKLGAMIEERPDGLVIEGGNRLRGAVVDSRHDHRMAMSLAVAGMLADGETVIDRFEAVSVSFPEFAAAMRQMGAALEA
jgi:3-phosphoshikimate 1-carboxyvinyltransferase